jgi:hypothetical protein
VTFCGCGISLSCGGVADPGVSSPLFFPLVFLPFFLAAVLELVDVDDVGSVSADERAYVHPRTATATMPTATSDSVEMVI